MRQISDAKELNQIYNQINNYIQNYIDSHKFLPSELHKFIRNNMDKFLEKNNLKDINRIQQIVEDVIQHRLGMEKDGVVPFYQFNQKIDESIFSSSGGGFEHEKALADHYETSVGHVEPARRDLNLYKINSFGDVIYAIIYSQEEIEGIKKDLIEKISSEVLNSKLEIDSIDGTNLFYNLDFFIKDIFVDVKPTINLPDHFLWRIFVKMIENSFNFNSTYRIPQSRPIISNGFYIWELHSK